MAYFVIGPRIYSLIYISRNTLLEGKPIRLSSDFSTETLQARREWHDVFNAMKQKGLEPRLLYPARLSFKFEGGIKQFPDKQKLREFTSYKPSLQSIWEGLL